MTVLTPLGILNGRSSLISDTLSSTNLSDDQSFSLRAPGSLDLSLGGLSASAFHLRLSGSSTDIAPASTTSSDLIYTNLVKGDYTVHVELPPNSNPAGSGSGGTGSTGGATGTGGSGSGTGSGGSGSGTGTPGTVQHQIVRLDYAGTVTQLSPLTSYQNQTGTGYTPNGLGLGSTVSGSIDVDLYQSDVVTSFTFNGQSLSADPANPGGLGELTAGAATAHGWSGDPSIGLVTLGTFLLNYASPLTTPGIKVTGGLNTQPLAPGLAYTVGGNTPYRSASSDNVIFTTVGVISGAGADSGSGGTGGGTGSGSGGTGTGSTGVTGSTSNNSARFTLTLTADYAGDDLTAADTEIPTNTKDSSGYIKATSTGVLKDWIGVGDKDYYSFTVNTPRGTTYSGTNVSVKLKGLAANVTVQFLNSTGKPLLDSTGKPLAPTVISGQDGSLQHIFSSGTYYVNVLSGGDTNYTLDFTETPLTTNLTFANTGSTKFLTNLWEFDASGRNSAVGIDPTKQTVLLIHGWNNGSLIAAQYVKDDLETLAESIVNSNPNEQVLALDWGQAAYEALFGLPFDSFAPYRAASHVTEVAKWAVSELQALGLKPGQLTLIGHSFGSYVADVIGHSSFGAVANLYALDPAATGLPLPYDLDSNTPGTQAPLPFREAAVNSFAFFNNQLVPTDSGNQAATALYSFVVDTNFNLFNPGTNHGAGILALTDLVKRGLVATNFSALKTKAGTILNPTFNQFNNRGFRFLDNKHEGVIHLKRSGASWVIGSLEYVNSTKILVTSEWTP